MVLLSNLLVILLEDMCLKMTISFINNIILCDKQILIQMNISPAMRFILAEIKVLQMYIATSLSYTDHL